MRPFILLFLGLSVACGTADRSANPAGDSTAVARQAIPPGVAPEMVEWRGDGVLVPSPDSLRKTPGYIVDSIFPPAEALRRFQATVVGAPVTRLAGGASDTDALLRRYWTLLVRRDTLGIRSLVVSHSEFAYVYLPESAIFASGMQPVGAWVMYESLTGRGLARAFRAAESGDTNVVSTPCRERARDEGKSRTYGPCAVVLRKGAGFDTLWIAGTVIRRDGVHKLLGLDNSL